MRIGELAKAVGTTPRTIRYYEEIGLLPDAEEREAGAHRTYGEEDVVLLKELLRLKNLLGVSLEELRGLVADEAARRVMREEFLSDDTTPSRRAELLDQLERILEHQLSLIARQRAELNALQAELLERRAKIARRRDELAALSQ